MTMPSVAGDRPMPLIALDQVLRLEPKRITTLKAVTANEPFFPGHYPDQPVYPGVYILEAVAQAVERLAAEQNLSARLRRLLSVRFRQPLQPGDVLETDCEWSQGEDPHSVTVKAVCTSANARVADVKATFELEPRA